MTYRESSCRVCGGELESILDLGSIHVSTFLRPEERPAPKVPHDLCACIDCGLVQLRHTVDPDQLYRQYWYKSGINESMVAELRDVVAAARILVPVDPDDYVIDIGANDGTLLAAYGVEGEHPIRVAYEPAKNLYQNLRPRCEALVSDYFPADSPFPLVHQAKIITSIACFYDLDDPKAFVEAIERVLHPDGVWIVQFQDWDQMRRQHAFDNICAEHLVYYTLRQFETLIDPYDLIVTDAEFRKVNGGSYRLYVRRKGHVVFPSVANMRAREYACDNWDALHQFKWDCMVARDQIRAAIQAEIDVKNTVDLYGASTKANTLLQWCGLTKAQLRYAWERSSDKLGLRTVGTDIPIVAEAIGRSDPPDALLAGIWQFRDSILRREGDYLGEGRRIIFPLPQVDVVTGGR